MDIMIVFLTSGLLICMIYIANIYKRINKYNIERINYYQRQTEQWLEMHAYHERRFDELQKQIDCVKEIE